MPATKFRCPDKIEHPILDCLKKCRMNDRCVPTPYLHLIAFDREWKGVSPSQAGNGPMQIALKQGYEYTIDPQDRVWAVLGVSTHAKLALHDYDVFSEEPLSDNQMNGIPDLLESTDDGYLLSDWKTWGSYKVAKALGLTTKEEPVLDDDGKPVLLKSGKNKGQPKTTKVQVYDSNAVDLRSEIYQLNKYRIFFRGKGFDVTKLQIIAIVRDGNTYIAKSRGVDKNLYIIPVPIIDDDLVNHYYENLILDVEAALAGIETRFCNAWECWDGRRCEGYCEVAEFCNRPEGWKGG